MAQIENTSINFGSDREQNILYPSHGLDSEQNVLFSNHPVKLVHSFHNVLVWEQQIENVKIHKVWCIFTDIYMLS